MKKFQIYLFALILIVFALNYYHVIQQGTYRDVFIPMAESLIENGILANHFFTAGGATYPLWGYVFLILPDVIFVTKDFFLLLFQFLACYIGILLFYKTFDLEQKLWHLPLLLPFIALMSTRMPDAPAGILLIVYAYYLKKFLECGNYLFIIFAGISLGAISNLRSEYLYLPLIQILGLLLPHFKKIRFRYAAGNAIVFVIAVVCMLPWAFRMKDLTDEFSFSATNGGAVAYISLGQLPGNVWNIKPYDQSAFEFTKSKGIDNAYSHTGDSLLKAESSRLVMENPFEYLKKCAYNVYKFFAGGVYTGEYANLSISYDRRYEINAFIESHSGVLYKIGAIAGLPIYESIPLVFEKVVQGLFIPIFAGLLFFSLWELIFKRNSPYPYLKKGEKNVLYSPLVKGVRGLWFLILSILRIKLSRNNHRQTSSASPFFKGESLGNIDVIEENSPYPHLKKGEKNVLYSPLVKGIRGLWFLILSILRIKLSRNNPRQTSSASPFFKGESLGNTYVSEENPPYPTLKKGENGYIVLLGVLLIIIVYKIALIAAIQYEYRHLNSIYLFLLGIGLSNFSCKRKKTLND